MHSIDLEFSRGRITQSILCQTFFALWCMLNMTVRHAHNLSFYANITVRHVHFMLNITVRHRRLIFFAMT